MLSVPEMVVLRCASGATGKSNIAQAAIQLYRNDAFDYQVALQTLYVMEKRGFLHRDPSGLYTLSLRGQMELESSLLTLTALADVLTGED